MKQLGLERYANPSREPHLRTSAEIAAALAAGKDRLLSLDVEKEYLEEIASFEATISHSLDEAHALIDGKWLLEHMAPTVTKRDLGLCTYEWLAHARSAGGLLEVREWWERATGNPP